MKDQKPRYENGNVVALCPDCGAVSVWLKNQNSQIDIIKEHEYLDYRLGKISYLFHKCSHCGRGGISKIHYNERINEGILEEFLPRIVNFIDIEFSIPDELEKEVREAEMCISINANRAAVALFRSTLEKILVMNGYTDDISRSLTGKIEEAFKDSLISKTHYQASTDIIKFLGDDVLHGDYKIINESDVFESRRFTLLILEDFYRLRKAVEESLSSLKRNYKSHTPQSVTTRNTDEKEILKRRQRDPHWEQV